MRLVSRLSSGPIRVHSWFKSIHCRGTGIAICIHTPTSILAHLMNLLRIAALWICCCVAAIAEPTPLAKAIAEGKVRADFSGNGCDSASLKLANTGSESQTLLLPAGSLLGAETGGRQVTLRGFEIQIEAGALAEAALPTAALATENTKSNRTLTLSAGVEPRLAPLVKLFASQNDLPRATAQLAVFIILEDIQWPVWRTWSAAAAGKPGTDAPTPAEVAQAVDALGLVRLALPEKKPALLASEELKRLALRHPQARGKAGALYGLSVENAVTGEPALPPDLKQLLHMSANDNCPICRLRQKAGADIP